MRNRRPATRNFEERLHYIKSVAGTLSATEIALELGMTRSGLSAYCSLHGISLKQNELGFRETNAPRCDGLYHKATQLWRRTHGRIKTGEGYYAT